MYAVLRTSNSNNLNLQCLFKLNINGFKIPLVSLVALLRDVAIGSHRQTNKTSGKCQNLSLFVHPCNGPQASLS